MRLTSGTGSASGRRLRRCCCPAAAAVPSSVLDACWPVNPCCPLYCCADGSGTGWVCCCGDVSATGYDRWFGALCASWRCSSAGCWLAATWSELLPPQTARHSDPQTINTACRMARIDKVPLKIRPLLCCNRPIAMAGNHARPRWYLQPHPLLTHVHRLPLEHEPMRWVQQSCLLSWAEKPLVIKKARERAV